MKKGERTFYKSAESRKRALLNYIYFNPNIIINDDYSDSIDIYYNNKEVNFELLERIKRWKK